MDSRPLYFIAIILPPKLSGEITTIKNNFSTRYHCSHALKLMPHITLQPPFKRGVEGEAELFLGLQQYFASVSSFKIDLNGYGNFSKTGSKVIFINAIKSNFLDELHAGLMNFLRKELKFSDKETPMQFHPHVTIASRDLSAENFEKAWAEYETKQYKAEFTASSVCLLKHNYRQWEVIGEFRFIPNIHESANS